jgi:hypothetical protein
MEHGIDALTRQVVLPGKLAHQTILFGLTQDGGHHVYPTLKCDIIFLERHRSLPGAVMDGFSAYLSYSPGIVVFAILLLSVRSIVNWFLKHAQKRLTNHHALTGE